MDTYIPQHDWWSMKTVVFGDQGTVERLIQAKRVAASSRRNKGRLVGIEPTPQDFHKEGVYNQVRNKSYCNKYGYSLAVLHLK